MEMRAEWMAPCGVNCRLCMAFQREKKACEGCRGRAETKPAHCVKCVVAHCEKRAGLAGGCGECEKPCRRMKYLDKSYREKYHMSPMENLQAIREAGMAAFLAGEEERWKCKSCGEVLCVHRETCPACGAPWVQGKKNEV